MNKAIWMALITLFMGVQTVYAHHLWVFGENEGLSVGRGQFPDRLDDYNPVYVSEVKGIDRTGVPVLLERKDAANRATFFPKNKIAVISVRCDWGDRVNTTRGKKLMNRKAAEAEGLKVISAFSSTQYSKTLFAPGKANCQYLGLKFELIPLSDPMLATPGTPIDFKLVFDGTPLAGCSVLTNRKKEYQTDANGVVQLTFKKSGRQLLYATNKVSTEKNTGLDFFKYMTFLAFEVNQ